MGVAPKKFQQAFLARLQNRFNSRSELVQEIGGTLCIGRDAVYRRLRGDTVLTAEELVILSRTYRISIDEGREASDIPHMYYHNGVEPVKSDVDYFLNLRKHTSWMADLPGVSVDYATPELPLFYELSTPVLRAFKVFIFGMTTWNLKKWERTPFHPNLISPETNEHIEALISDAYRMPGRELWSIGILDVTLRQIAYMLQIGRLTDETIVETLFDELEQIVRHLEAMARRGKRFPMGAEPTDESPDFQVFHNELSNTNNAVIVTSEERNIMFSTVMSPNYVMGEDERLIRDARSWFNRLVANGSPLNEDSGKYTHQYFSQLKLQIATAKQRSRYVNVVF